jgi:glucan phosphoethanolaminetransferase (alkaline phosphatase superfamily)
MRDAQEAPPDLALRIAMVVVIAAWVAALALPNLLAIPVWPWTPELWTVTGGEDATTFGLHDAIRSLVAGVIVSIVLLAAIGRYGYFAVATLPLVLLVPLEAWYIAEYGQPSSAHVLGVLLETNVAELSEFYGAGMAIAIVGYGVFVAIAMATAWMLLRSRQGLSSRVRIWVLAIVIGTFGATVLSQSRPADGASQPDHDRWRAFADDVGGIFPWGVPVRIAEYAAERRAIVAQVARAGTVPLGAKLDAARAPVNVVLVIGESARADRFGIGPGAPRTTPRLAAIDGIVHFEDVVTPAAATRLAVPYIVAGLVDADAGPAGGQPSVVAAFREAGYRTWWISNHNTVGQHDDTIAPYAEEADSRRFVNPGSSIRTSALDGVLVGELERALATPAERRFVVLHMLGSHFNYRFRYPDAFDRFQPSLARDQATSIFDGSQREKIRNAYDNSILYTDHVLAELIASLARTNAPSALLFVSDHGQVLFEGMCGKAGHGLPSALTYRVPMLLWMSESLRALRPDAARELVAHRTSPLTITAVAPTLAQLGAVSVPGMRTSASVASPSWVAETRRVTPDAKQWIDFDRDVAKLDCATAQLRAPRR